MIRNKVILEDILGCIAEISEEIRKLGDVIRPLNKSYTEITIYAATIKNLLENINLDARELANEDGVIISKVFAEHITQEEKQNAN